MTIVADTYKTKFKEEYNQGKSISAGDYKKVLINWNKRSSESGVYIKYPKRKLDTDFSEQNLTNLTSDMSTSSFTEIWEEEKDDYWNSYLED